MTLKRAILVGIGIVFLLIGIGSINKLYYNQDLINERIERDNIKILSITNLLQEQIDCSNSIVELQLNSIKLDIIDLYKLNILAFTYITKLAIVSEELGKGLETLAKRTPSVDVITQEKNRIRFLKEKLKQVNVTILNKTLGGLGSATTIKYNGKFYLLSAAHLLGGNNESEMFLSEQPGETIDKLKIIKVDVEKDLVLFAPITEIQPKIWVELASEEPPTGEDVFVVGNPCGFYDVLSRAIIMMYDNDYCIALGNAYFGNSGGAMFNNRGEVIGVMSVIGAIQADKDLPAFKLDGAIRLNEVLKFMESIGDL